MLRVSNKLIILSVVMLSAHLLGAVMLSVIILRCQLIIVRHFLMTRIFVPRAS
jgi:hypothetical protein